MFFVAVAAVVEQTPAVRRVGRLVNLDSDRSAVRFVVTPGVAQAEEDSIVGLQTPVGMP